VQEKKLDSNNQTITWKKKLEHFYDHNEQFILPIPSLIVVVIMLVFPVIYMVYLSFFKWSGGLTSPKFIGLENYSTLIENSRFWLSLWRTIYFVSLSIFSQVGLGLITALIFHRPFFGRGFARTIYLFPMISTPAALALVWKMMLDPTIGSLSYIVQKFGGPQMEWASNVKTVIPTLVMIDTWQWTPLVMLIILAGLAALPIEPYEAASVDGATKLQAFYYITLPLLRPTLAVAAMFRTIDAIKTFDIIVVITGGGPGYASEILNIYAYSEALTNFKFGYGSALLVVLTILVVIVALIFNKFRRGGYWA
jgi:multiple sugar transport system permease protein